MTKLSKNTLSFPIVLKRVVDDLVISVPDLGFYKNVPLKLEVESAKSANVVLSNEFKAVIISEIESLWKQTEDHRNRKKWQPDPSTFKQSLQSAEEDYSLPDFVKKLNQFISVSENTIRREIKRGSIRCYQTEGGHRRIPVSEVATYLKKIDTTKSPVENSI